MQLVNADIPSPLRQKYGMAIDSATCDMAPTNNLIIVSFRDKDNKVDIRDRWAKLDGEWKLLEK